MNSYYSISFLLELARAIGRRCESQVLDGQVPFKRGEEQSLQLVLSAGFKRLQCEHCQVRGIGASVWIFLIISGPFFLEWSVGNNNLSFSSYFNIECVLKFEPAAHVVMNPLIGHVFNELLNGHFNFLSYIVPSIRSTWICSSFDNALNVATLFPFLLLLLT